GLTMHEGTIQRYFKAPGDQVRAGEPVYEVETEKVLYEVEAPAGGTLAAVLFAEGATVECGTVVAVIAEPNEDIRAVAARSAAAPAPSEDGGGRRAASPVARKLAAELGVELAGVVGTGPGGRITREDVERAATAARSTSTAAAAPARAGAPAQQPAGTAGAPAVPAKPTVRTLPMR